MKLLQKLVACSFFLCALNFHASAQITALTSTGREVFLYEDGRWEYAADVPSEKIEYGENKGTFKKPSGARFPVKSNKVNLTVYMDVSKWTFSKGLADDASEYKFQLKGEDAYAMMITERAEIPIEALAQIALSNAREVPSDAEIVMAEYRNVNNIRVLCLQMKGTMQGIKFMYYGYYYSNENGSIQFVTYTVQNLFESYKKEMELLLNGLMEND
ncbi:MAG TPA: hypothetical protein DEU93_00025 [Chitinophagaceae bacterium]|nr:hypothetical protein [Chitinophagaceae bacterium]